MALNYKKLLEGKTALITGCGRGIGKATLELFAKAGANVFAVVRKTTDEFLTACKELESECSVRVIPLVADITDKEQVKNIMKQIIEQGLPLDILVNNAGVLGENKLFLMTTIDEQKKVFETNYFGNMLVTQYAAKLMIRQKKGSVINVASIAGIDGELAQLEYVASKAAIIGATKKLARELGVYNIRVNAVAPGLTKTDMASNMSEKLMQNTIEKIIMKRIAEPNEIANAVMFFASDLASYITGQILRVDGGV